MGRYKKGAMISEDYVRIPKSVSLPAYLVRDLEAQGKLSIMITEILETHKEAIGDGVYKDVMQRRKELIVQEVDSALRARLPIVLDEIVTDVLEAVIKRKNERKDI